MTAEKLLAKVGVETAYCDKCKSMGHIVVICQSCRDEICEGCALKAEIRERMCFSCIDRVEGA